MDTYRQNPDGKEEVAGKEKADRDGVGIQFVSSCSLWLHHEGTSSKITDIDGVPTICLGIVHFSLGLAIYQQGPKQSQEKWSSCNNGMVINFNFLVDLFWWLIF